MAVEGVITRKHVVAAWHYQYGREGGGRDNWPMACVDAGFTGRSPSLDSAATQEAMETARELQGLSSTMTDDEDMRAIQLAVEGEANPDWLFLAPLARRVMAKIAAGRAAATTQQVAALKEILVRAEGKAGEKKQAAPEDDLPGVVILPVVMIAGVPMLDVTGLTEREVEEG